MTGISVDTLRAWERRYHVVKPSRSARGRLYGDADVQRFISLRNAMDKGFAIGEIASLPDSELAKILALPEKNAFASGSAAEPEAGLDLLLAAVESFDSVSLNGELGRLAALLTPAAFVYKVALPLMRAVGDRWHAGTMQTAQEHLVTECLRNLLGAMARLNQAPGSNLKLLATTPAQELHELGMLAGAVLAGARGFEVACLGPNLPASEILYAVERFSPRILLVGMVTPNPLPGAVETVSEVAASLPANTELWLGGAGALVALDAIRDGNGMPPGIIYLEDLQALDRLLLERRNGRHA